MRARHQLRGQRLGPRGGAGRQRMLRGQPGTGGVFGVLVAGRQRVAVLRDQQVLQALLGRQLIVGLLGAHGQIRAADRHAGLRVGDVVLEFLGPVHRVDRHDHGIRAQDRVVRNDELRAILHIQQHPVALLHAGLLLQPARHGAGLGFQRPEGDGVAEIADGRLVGVAMGGDHQVVPERGLRQHDLGRHALGPELEMRARGLGGLHKGLLCGLSDLILGCEARNESGEAGNRSSNITERPFFFQSILTLARACALACAGFDAALSRLHSAG